MNELALLRAMRNDLDDPARWCGAGASKGKGRCLITSRNRLLAATGLPYGACEFGVGGLVAQLLDAEAIRMVPGIEHALHLRPCAEFNETHTHAEVLTLLDRCIARAEEQTYGAPLGPLPVDCRELVAA